MSKECETLQAMERTDDPVALQELYSTLLPLLKEAWKNPHPAMELLEIAVEILPFALAHSFAKEVANHWQSLGNYEWSAGGNAGHCYLSALLLSGNAELIEPELYLKWSSDSLSKAKKLRDRTKDAAAKKQALVESLNKILKWVGENSDEF